MGVSILGASLEGIVGCFERGDDMDLTRRGFISALTVTLVLMLVIEGCGTTESRPQADAGTPADAGTGCTGPFPTTSADDTHHAHRVCVPLEDLVNPPGGGRTYVTTKCTCADPSRVHTHTVTLSQSQLQMINSGTTVTVETSVELPDTPHTHSFSIQKR
jgi:hypothetical protein